MPERDWHLRIHDIAVAIEKIERYTANMALADFQSDERTVDAVLRNFEIIGEAAGNVPQHVTEANPNILWRRCAYATSLLTPTLAWTCRSSGRPSSATCRS